MIRQSLLIALIILMILTGCVSSIDVEEVPIANSMDISVFSTYRWDRSSLVTIAPDERAATDYGVIIIDEIDKMLAALGYSKVDDGTADITMDFRVTIKDLVAQFVEEDSIDIIEYKSPYGLQWRFGKDDQPVHLEMATPAAELAYYEEGTLHIGAFDLEKKLAWHAMAHKIINKKHLPVEHEKVLRQKVRLIMTRFPPHKDSD